MRYFIALVLLFACLRSADALTPWPDSSPSFFSGEWAGAGEQGAYCYLNLSADGWGWVLIDGGSGDWLGARMQWRNLKQTLQLERIIPLPTSTQRRIMPLTKFVLRSGFNQSLSLKWNAQSSACQLQKIDTTRSHLNRARSTLNGLLQARE